MCCKCGWLNTWIDYNQNITPRHAAYICNYAKDAHICCYSCTKNTRVGSRVCSDPTHTPLCRLQPHTNFLQSLLVQFKATIQPSSVGGLRIPNMPYPTYRNWVFQERLVANTNHPLYRYCPFTVSSNLTIRQLLTAYNNKIVLKSNIYSIENPSIYLTSATTHDLIFVDPDKLYLKITLKNKQILDVILLFYSPPVEHTQPFSIVCKINQTILLESQFSVHTNTAVGQTLPATPTQDVLYETIPVGVKFNITFRYLHA